MTPIDIIDDHPPADDLDDDGDGLTRVREIVSIDPDAAVYTRPSAATEPKTALVVPEVPRFDLPPSASVVDEATQMRAPTPAPAVDDDPTIMRPPRVVAPHASAPAAPAAPSAPVFEPATASTDAAAVGASAPPTRRSRRGLWIALSVAASVVFVVGAIVGLNVLVAGIQTTPEVTETAEPQDVVSDFVPRVADLAGTRQGDQIVFTWINQDPQEGDRFLWSVVDVSGQVDPQQVDDAVAQLPATPGTVCIDVMLRREDGRVSEPVRGCVDG